MNKALISSVVFGVLIAGSAMAAELPLKAPPAPPPVCNWCGWYIGINGGGVWGKSDTSLDVQNVFTPTGGTAVFTPAQIAALDAFGTNSFNTNGWLIGGQVGYLYEDLNTHFVFAAEVSVDATQFRGSFSNPQLIGGHNFTFNDGFRDTSLLAIISARIGYDFGGSARYGYFGGFIPYWTIGAAALKVNHTFSDVDTTFFPGCACAVNFGNQFVGGAVVGGGVEIRFVDHWSLRGEYLYIDFGSTSGSLLVGNGTGSTASFTRSVTLKESIARGFLSYHF
jgi:outer membrane immunogenic protein